MPGKNYDEGICERPAAGQSAAKQKKAAREAGEEKAEAAGGSIVSTGQSAVRQSVNRGQEELDEIMKSMPR